MKFRTDISFLRALSVIIVMFFHFDVPGFSGGFIGVDVFFVISGFLMTQIILRSFEKETFSLRDFYAKRIKRIIPPLQAVLFFVLIISSVFFFESDIKLNAKYTFLADFFVSNIYFWNYQDYFTSTDNILLHSWTLGVEWQFYLIYPVLLLIFRKIYFNKRKIFWIFLILLCISSFLTMLWIGRSSVNFIFYMLPTRFWELSIGGLAYGFGVGKKPSVLVQKVLVFLGVLTILISNLFINETVLWPSLLTLMPVLATVIILAVNANFSFFNNSFVKFLGDISYSLYLWHWPWYILFKYFGFLQFQYIIVMIMLSIGSAYLSYTFIETQKAITTVKFSIASTLIIGFLSIILFSKPDLVRPVSIYQSEKFEIGDFTSRYISSEKEKQFNECGCFETTGRFNKVNCMSISASKPNILLFGDSHAAHFSASLRMLKQYNILQASAGFTLPFLKRNGKGESFQVINYVYSDFLMNNKVDLVIISASWMMRNNPNIGYSEEQVLIEISALLKFFNDKKIKYIFVGQSETYSLSYPKILMLKHFGKDEKEFIEPETNDLNKKIKMVVDRDHYIDIYNSPLIKHFDSISKNPYMFDNSHFTTYGADQIVQKIIAPQIVKKLVSN